MDWIKKITLVVSLVSLVLVVFLAVFLWDLLR